MDWTRIAAGLFRRLSTADQQAILDSSDFRALPYAERMAFLDAEAELANLDKRDQQTDPTRRH